MKLVALSLALVASLGILACGEKPEGSAASKPPAAAAAAPNVQPPPASDKDLPPSHPENKGIYVDAYKIGKSSWPDGMAREETGGHFRSGSDVFMSFVLRNAPADSEVRAVWKSVAKDATISEEVVKMGEKGFVHFELKGASKLADGDYRVETSFREKPGASWSTLGHNDFKISPTGK
jgi:hypothetical protein